MNDVTDNQLIMLMEFMEENGDIHCTRYVAHRQSIKMKWKELVKKLNNGNTANRTSAAWSKVWRDYKTYIKTKLTNFIRASNRDQTGNPVISDIEFRALDIMQNMSAHRRVQVKTDSDETPEPIMPMPLPISTGPQVTFTGNPDDVQIEMDGPDEASFQIKVNVLPDQPATSNRRSTTFMDIKKAVLELVSEPENGRDTGRRQEQINVELERERIRQRDEELRLRDNELAERARQRDIEFQFQDKLLDCMADGMQVLKRFVEKTT